MVILPLVLAYSMVLCSTTQFKSMVGGGGLTQLKSCIFIQKSLISLLNVFYFFIFDKYFKLYGQLFQSDVVTDDSIR